MNLKGEIKARIFKPETGNELYLTVGDLSTSGKVAEIKEAVTQSGIMAFTNQTKQMTVQEHTTAKVLLNGEIIKGDSLLK